MTSRPGPGVQESLQHRGGASAYAPGRRAANPQHGQQDSVVEVERAPIEERERERVTKARYKGKPIPLDAIQTTPSESTRPAPKGKPQLFFSHAVAGGSELSSQVHPLANLPVPPRPGSSAPGEAPQQRRILPGGAGVKSEPAVKLQSYDAPAPAVVFPGAKTADLFPWTGNHPEDVLSEALVKGGISNKSQIMNETNTARPSLWSNLKNKSGVSTLSTLFVAVLEKRQSCSRLTVPNSFKPPPRLTLRDSTRETWLHDLANPMVGLRRLSRTIPHGITGKVLLDQCLNKNIPISRAVWLAKCVGINEMRTHKRKGQAGTITWVRGWTSSVEQFLEGTITTIGQQDWKPRITYALQLVTHLFKEHLLEEDHFLDWILKGLDSCSSERLFVWLLIVCISDFWHSLVASRRRGKRLAETLLSHTEKFYELEDDVPSTSLLAFLENVLLQLIVTKPACLLLPTPWAKYFSVLQVLAERRSQPAVSRAINNIDARNNALLRPSNSALALTHDPIGQIYRLLDAVDYKAKIRIDDLSYDCMEVTPDTNQLVSALLSWASSLYRQGCHRIYLVTRLLRKWDRLGADIHDAILTHFPHLVHDESKDHSIAFRVVAELVRSKTFSPGKFLQWLIATGSLSHHDDLRSPSAWPLRLITEIPLTGLSEPVQNLRYTLLRGTCYSADVEEHDIITMEERICQQLPGLFCISDSVDVHNMSVVQMPDPTVRLEVGAWLRQQVAESMEFVEHIPTKDPSVEVSGDVCSISSAEFHVIRSYLELFEDLSVLADVISIVATSLDSTVLSAAADTLSYNFEAFRAVGAFESLFEKVAMRYAAIRTVRFPERDLLLSLTDLARTAHADSQLMQLLSYDLSRYDQRNSLAACSPASDSMVDGTVTMDLEDEIERVLSSGTSMDQQMMSRVFEKIISNLEEQLCKGSDGAEYEHFSTWLYRLRSFEESSFDVIVASWLRTLLLGHQAQLLSAALPLLVASGCLSLSRFLTTLRECVKSRQLSHPGDSLRIAAEGLDKLIPVDQHQGSSRHYELYRFRLEQRNFCRQHGGDILGFLGNMILLESGARDHETNKRLSAICSGGHLLSVLRHLAITDVRSVTALISPHQNVSNRVQTSHLKSLVGRLFDPLNRIQLGSMNYEEQVATVIRHADQLSLPFCQLVLQQIFSASALAAEPIIESVSTAFMSTIKVAIDQEQPCWSDLISGLEPGLINKIRNHAVCQVIENTAFLCDATIDVTTEVVADRKAAVRRYLSVIDITEAGSSSEEPGPLVTSLIDRFRGLIEAFSRVQDIAETSGNESARGSDLRFWLNVLLRLMVVHCPALVAKASNQQQATLLWTLRGVLSHPYVEAYPATALFVFDVATLFSDSVSEDVRKHLCKVDAGKNAGDARCAYIFGGAISPDGWLNLMKPTTNASLPQSVLSPQAKLLATTAGPNQHQNQQPFPPGSGPMQRTASQQNLPQQTQAQSHARAYQYPQTQPGHKILPQQLQRVAPNGHGGQTTQLQQLQQMQQMQAFAQQRNVQASQGQQQRAVSISSQQQIGAKSSATKKEKVEMKAVPFTLNRWEILPDSGGNPSGNETAINLSLFGARKA
ncbi:hypothetical protein CC80DRAFT_441342 [Byssothecium circinans]|uniref:Mediator of RNA polymerase II transcription subunit 12 n=1 Tax=Byssothecium circinans TaxID=147558 RepID=A0A6A5U787_9PLEO|nr:hypothetical protein CC80DRAFT_441342 [Byssothecium circinans]